MHFVTRATPMFYIDEKGHKFETEKKQKLFNQSHKVHIMLLVINSRGGQTDTHTHTTYTNIPTSTPKRPGMRWPAVSAHLV